MPDIAGIHPYADKFPMLPEDELAELAESVAAIGLIQPIVIDPAGLVLDGRNRLEACARAGVAATTTVYDGDDPAEFVIGSNVTRRNMTTGARAMATALVLEAAGRRTEGRWEYGQLKEKYESVQSSGFRIRLAECGVVLDNLPEVAAQVVAGDVTLDAAYRQACEKRDAKRDKLAEQKRLEAEEADAKAFIEATDPALAAMVAAGELETYAEAQAVWEKRNREEAKRIRDEQAAEQKRLDAEREHRIEKFTNISDAILTLSSWGEYDDPLAVTMADYALEYLKPVQRAEYFGLDKIAAAHRMTALIMEWSKKQ